MKLVALALETHTVPNICHLWCAQNFQQFGLKHWQQRTSNVAQQTIWLNLTWYLGDGEKFLTETGLNPGPGSSFIYELQSFQSTAIPAIPAILLNLILHTDLFHLLQSAQNQIILFSITGTLILNSGLLLTIFCPIDHC